MSKFFQRFKFWFNNSRPYTIPITFLSWLVIFIYSFKLGGNILYGIIAYLGIAVMHLVTNLADDYFDYIRLSRCEKSLQSAKDSKCRYLKNGQASLKELLVVIILMLFFSFIVGAFLFFVSGFYVLFFALIALFIALFYSKLSSRGYGDAAVIVAYGPLMYEGVYYVMCGEVSLNVLILSLGCGLFVDSILYASTILDFEEDSTSGKKTLSTILNSAYKGLNALILLYLIGFLFIFIFMYYSSNYFILSILFVIPLIVDLYTSMKLYISDKNYLPEIHFWNYPLDNWSRVKNDVCASYFLRFFYVRNIAVWALLLICISLVIV